MVALHNKKLSETEIFRGVLWNDQQWHAQRDIFRAELEAQGVTGAAQIFALSRKMEEYQRAQPSMRERQGLMKRFYPGVPPRPVLPLSPDEIAWLIERLDGVNDPTGIDIRERLLALAERNSIR